MSDSDNRSEERMKVCVQAFAFDAKDTFNIKCIIRDVSETGCMIVSSRVYEFPQFIQLVPENFNRPLNGKIIWRDDKRAGVAFLSPTRDDVLALLKETCDNASQSGAEVEEAMLLGASVLPQSYAERLAKYVPPRK